MRPVCQGPAPAPAFPLSTASAVTVGKTSIGNLLPLVANRPTPEAAPLRRSAHALDDTTRRWRNLRGERDRPCAKGMTLEARRGVTDAARPAHRAHAARTAPAQPRSALPAPHRRGRWPARVKAGKIRAPVSLAGVGNLTKMLAKQRKPSFGRSSASDAAMSSQDRTSS